MSTKNIMYKEIDKLIISNEEISKDNILFTGIKITFTFDNAIRVDFKNSKKYLVIDFEKSDVCEKFYNKLNSQMLK